MGASTIGGASTTGDEWIVLLEAADERGRSTIDEVSLGRLVTAWGDPAPSTLYSPDRYALQVSVRAIDPPSALSSAMLQWKDALRRAGLPDWGLVRAEILTPDELEQELRTADRTGDARNAWAELRPLGHELVGDDLLRRALHDAVTGLPDRELFLDEVRRAAATRVAPSSGRSVMVVNVDVVGDAGRTTGPPPDEVLVEIAGRLVRAVRPGDTVARVGPVDFALLMDLPSGNDTDSVARRIVERLRPPVVQHGRTLGVTPSIGVATMSPTDDADVLILLAETAMAAAKRAGGRSHRSLAGPATFREAT